MQKKIYVLISVVCILLSISGCEKKDSIVDSTQKVSVLVPLSQGNQWKYLRTFYDTLGIIIKQDTMIQIISKDTLIYGFKWAFEPNPNPHSPPNSEILYRNDEEGLWQYIGQPRLIYRYPSTKGTVFYQFDSPVTIVSTDTIITTSAGAFKCYHYQIDFNFTGLLINQFIAPDVGFIKVESPRYKNIYIQYPIPYICERDELISLNVIN